MRLLKIIFTLVFMLTANIRPVFSAGGGNVYIPLISANSSSNSTLRTINIPYFNVNDLSERLYEMAILWFGKVNLDENYTDVRIGYNASELYIRVQIFDRRLWYNPTPETSTFETWDSLALTLQINDGASKPTSQTYRFLSQLHWTGDDPDYKKAYQGNGNVFVEKSLNFSANVGWRGVSPDENVDNRGWLIDFRIPFGTLGLSTAPANGTLWRLGFTQYDRDTENGPAFTPKIWPENKDDQNPNTWGRLRFGNPLYSVPSVANPQTSMIREGDNGNHVPDSAVGGGSICGDGLNFWTEWGNKNYQGDTFFNVQNQADVADWPCFSKYYVTFPTGNIPQGKVIKSARLSVHQFGGSDPTQAYPSLIQVLTVKEDWVENLLTWNNAPLALENITQTWVEVIQNFKPWPGDEYTFDVSHAVEQAYRNGTPVRLVLYSADTAYHSGKYFSTSDVDDWNAVGRPTLFVEWGDAY